MPYITGSECFSTYALVISPIAPKSIVIIIITLFGMRKLEAQMKIYLVGGAVRDRLLDIPVKDQDWVVVGATPEQMLSKGYQQVGADFPVFLHPKTKEEYAIIRNKIELLIRQLDEAKTKNYSKGASLSLNNANVLYGLI